MRACNGLRAIGSSLQVSPNGGLVSIAVVAGESWAHYVRQVCAGLSQKDAAARAGVDASSLGRWLHGAGVPLAHSVVAFARHMGRSPVEALVAAGYLTADEAASVVEVFRPLSDWSDDELIAELSRRLKRAL